MSHIWCSISGGRGLPFRRDEENHAWIRTHYRSSGAMSRKPSRPLLIKTRGKAMSTRYASLVEDYMRRARPGSGWDRAASQDLGEQIATEIASREASLTNWSTIPDSSDHLAHVAALQAIRSRAEEEVLQEMLYEAYPAAEEDEVQNEASWMLEAQNEAAAYRNQLRETEDEI